jgi:hypothetical protein
MNLSLLIALRRRPERENIARALRYPMNKREGTGGAESLASARPPDATFVTFMTRSHLQIITHLPLALSDHLIARFP